MGTNEGVVIWEISIDIFTLPCVKYIASGKQLCSTGSSAQCSVMTWRGVGCGGGGSEAQEDGKCWSVSLVS